VGKNSPKRTNKIRLTNALAYLSGSWLAIIVRTLYLSNFDLSQIDRSKLFYEFGMWSVISIFVILGGLWNWEKNEKRYLETESMQPRNLF
jgi:hypothetical protein